MRPEKEGAGMEGQSQRRSAPRGLSAEAAEAGAGDMFMAAALGACAESAAGAGTQPKPSDCEARTPNQKKKWHAAQRKQRK